MFDMRRLPLTGLGPLSTQERDALRLVADGLGPKEIAARSNVSEDAVYRLVAWVLDEVEPAPAGRTVASVHAEHRSRAATAGELDEFEQLYGASLPADHEG
jgi:FixJ family two-component response regulator